MTGLRLGHRVATGIVAVFAVTALAACSGGSKAPSASASPSDTGSGVVQIWGAVPAANGPQDLIDSFQKAYPKIKVVYTQYVQDPTGNLKLDTALQGGANIDVFFSYLPNYLSQRVDAGLAMDLTQQVKADAAMKPLASPDVSLQFDEKLYSLPTNKAPAFTFINKNMLDAANIKVPQKWTVDEFHKIAQQLTKGDVHGTFRAPSIAVPTLGPDAIYTKKGDANFTDPAWTAEADLNQAMAKDGSAFPEEQVLSQQLASYPQNTFIGKKVGLWVNDSYNFRFLNNAADYPHDFITTFAPAPTPDGVSSPWNTGTFDNWISIAQKSKNKVAAWTFVKYWLGDGAKYMIKAGKVSPLETDKDAIVKGLLGENPEKRYDVDAFKRVYFDSSIKMGVQKQFTALAEITAAKNTLTSQLRLGQISAEDWSSQLQSQAEAAIAKAKSK